MSDLIRRDAVYNVLKDEWNPTEIYNLSGEDIWKYCEMRIESLPSAQPERLTDDDFETIRIHLNAHKEKLCNQRRWEEAEEYQRIIDRFMAFASAQPEIIRCNECKYYEGVHNIQGHAPCTYWKAGGVLWNWFCSQAERWEDE